MAYDNTNSGVLFKNKDKQDENHPDYQGSINVGGKEFWLSAWIRTGKENSKMPGEKFMALRVKPKESRQSKPKGHFDDIENDVPW